MTKNKFLIIFWAVFYIAIFAALINHSFSYLDADFGWHLKLGERILNDGFLPVVDYYSWTYEGQFWVDIEWLSNILVYYVYSNFGYIYLNIIYALLIVVILIVQNIFTQKYYKVNGGLGYFLIAFFQALGVLACIPHFGVREQEVSVLGSLLLFIIILQYNKSHNLMVLFFIPPLFYFWSLLHGGFLIGIVVMFFWIFIKIVENLLFKFKYFNFIDYSRKINFNQLMSFVFFAFCGIAATLVTPYGINLYSHMIVLFRDNYYSTHIIEWLPVYYLSIQYWQVLFEAILLAAIFIFVFYVIKKKSYKIYLFEFLLAIFLLILAIKSVRHFPLLFVISAPLMTYYFFVLLDYEKNNYIYKKIGKYFSLVKIYLIIGLLCITAAIILDTKFVNNPFAFFKNVVPYEAVNFLKEKPEYNNLKIYNEYNWGGYLIWMLPETKLFIAGQLPQQPFAGKTLLEEYNEFYKEGNAKKKLEQYQIDLVLIYSQERKIMLNWVDIYVLHRDDEIINSQSNNLKKYLDSSQAWQLVYSDNLSSIYVKKQ